MVLYCMTHGGNILRAIVHKFRYHPEDEAVFFVDKDASSPYCPKIEKIKYYRMPSFLEIVDPGWSAERIGEQTNNAIGQLLKETGVDPLQFSHIYVLFDRINPFTLYFELNSIKYMAIELSAGQFYHWSNYNKPGKMTIQLVLDMHLNDACGNNCIKGFLFSDESRGDIAGIKGELEVYDFLGTLIGLDGEHKRQILEGYRMDQCGDFDAVMMLNSRATLVNAAASYRSDVPYKGINDDPLSAFYPVYKIVFDYYFGDLDFILKLHPESDENFEKAFSEFKQLPKEVPMEVFFLLDKKFDIYCPADSTGILIFKEHGFNVINFELMIFSFVRQIHLVFLACTLINAICTPAKILVHCVSPQQMDFFKKWVYPELADVEFERLSSRNTEDALFILADDSSADFPDMIRDVPEDCLIIANGSCRADEGVFAKQEMIYSIIDVSEAEEEELRKCCWTIMSKNKDLIDALRDFSASYILEKSKLKIQSAPHN